MRLVVLLILAACAPERLDAERDDASARAISEGTPEAAGVLGLLNDPATDLRLLDDDVPLDARAARNLIAHRDGPDGVAGTADDDPFDTIEEVDGVSQVGPATLDRLLAYALDNGWVPEGDDLLGVFDGVPFTVAEADATLALANSAEAVWLDETLDLDRRAVDSIVAARPIDGMQTLAELYYVGGSALRALRDASTAAPDGVEARVVADLEVALGAWYARYGADVAAMGGNDLAAAIAALSPAAVTEVTDPDEDPYGYDLGVVRAFSHPDVVFPGSDGVWYAYYDRDTGALIEADRFN